MKRRLSQSSGTNSRLDFRGFMNQIVDGSVLVTKIVEDLLSQKKVSFHALGSEQGLVSAVAPRDGHIYHAAYVNCPPPKPEHDRKYLSGFSALDWATDMRTAAVREISSLKTTACLAGISMDSCIPGLERVGHRALSVRGDTTQLGTFLWEFAARVNKALQDKGETIPNSNEEGYPKEDVTNMFQMSWLHQKGGIPTHIIFQSADAFGEVKDREFFELSLAGQRSLIQIITSEEFKSFGRGHSEYRFPFFVRFVFPKKEDLQSFLSTEIVQQDAITRKILKLATSVSGEAPIDLDFDSLAFMESIDQEARMTRSLEEFELSIHS